MEQGGERKAKSPLIVTHFLQFSAGTCYFQDFGKSINPLDPLVCKMGLNATQLGGYVRTKVSGRQRPLIWVPYEAAIPINTTISKL